MLIEKSKEEAIIEMENTDYEMIRQNLKNRVCPECNNEMHDGGGCPVCVCCGYSKCS